MKKFFLASIAVMILFSLALVFVALPLYISHVYPSQVHLTSEEFNSSQPLYIPHGKLLSQRTNQENLVGEDDQRYVELKLFGFIPVKRIKVELLPFEEVIPGGELIGFLAKVDGVLVTADAPEHNLKKGDIIKRLGGNDVSCLDDFNAVITKSVGTSLDAIVKRKDKTVQTKINVKMPLGIWLKDETSGIGTMTYINPQNNNFASLGHQLNDYETAVHVDLRGGNLYGTNILSVEKGDGKKIGTYKSSLRHTPQGDVLSSNDFGVFGCLYERNMLVKDKEALKVTSRYNVRPGKAKLRTTMDGEVREYDVEIIKTRFQKKPSIKSMVIRVTDKELLAKSGGIIHGMSGSPIIQNGRIVGALTHVVTGDNSKGWGIYIDFVVP